MTTDRRAFLGASLFAATGAKLSRIDAHPAPQSSEWDVSWAARVQGAQFRAVFDSPEIADGLALFRATGWCNQYREVYGTQRSAMAPVVVLRHNGIHLVMNDEYWKRFKIAKEFKVKSLMGKGVDVNPVATPQADAPPPFAGVSIPKFLSDGGVVLACNWAFADVVAKYQAADKLDDAAASTAAKSQMIPGVIMQPSGVFAVLRAQEAGAQYMIAS
ncbi:MAG TPA: hypothetical protein VJR92_02260 [Gemmatimonadaceae bacterium]|nr:hypothetical protein [Gemmatimonadaceae bacterium]